jgi:hypothetical protein
LDTFIDNVATLAIERILLRDLPDLVFAGCDSSRLTNEELEVLAGKPPEITQQRTKAKCRLAALEAVLYICKQYQWTI